MWNKEDKPVTVTTDNFCNQFCGKRFLDVSPVSGRMEGPLVDLTFETVLQNEDLASVLVQHLRPADLYSLCSLSRQVCSSLQNSHCSRSLISFREPNKCGPTSLTNSFSQALQVSHPLLSPLTKIPGTTEDLLTFKSQIWDFKSFLKFWKNEASWTTPQFTISRYPHKCGDFTCCYWVSPPHCFTGLFLSQLT